MIRSFTISSALVLSVVAAAAVSAQNNGVPSEIAPVVAPFETVSFQRPVFPENTFAITDYGAVERGENPAFKNTDAIHRAIEAAHEAGGGTVLIPEGDWLTGPIHLMSHINLHLAEGATVLFSEDRDDYLPVVRQRHEGVEAYNYSPLIYAFEVENVAITGKGVLDGQGDHWWEWHEEHGSPPRAIATQVPLTRRDFGKGSGMEGMRPNFVVFWKSDNILVEGITLNDGPMWNIHLIYSHNAIVRDVTVNSLNAPNGDGVVIDSSRDVLVEYNHFETGDDAVVLKSGLNEEGLAIDIPTERIIVRNFEAADVRTGSGGIVFGSETSGGIRDVLVHDAYFEETDKGIRFKTERGRGNVIENIYIRDIRMKDVRETAINVNTFYTGPEATGPAPLIRNIEISRVEIDGVPTAITMTGLPEKWLENVSLEAIDIRNAGRGARFDRVKNLRLKDVSISSGERGMIATNVYEVTLENVTLRDETDGVPLLFEGEFTGAVILDEYPRTEIDFGDGATEDIIITEERTQAW